MTIYYKSTHISLSLSIYIYIYIYDYIYAHTHARACARTHTLYLLNFFDFFDFSKIFLFLPNNCNKDGIKTSGRTEESLISNIYKNKYMFILHYIIYVCVCLYIYIYTYIYVSRSRLSAGIQGKEKRSHLHLGVVAIEKETSHRSWRRSAD